MRCVTGAETDLGAVFERIRACKGAELFEVRLDLLERPGIQGEPPCEPGRLVVACRPARQSGGFRGPEEERCRLLESAISAWRPGWVDLDSDTPSDLAGRISSVAAGAGTKLLVSSHVTGPFDLGVVHEEVDRLAAFTGHARKLAVEVDDAALIGPLLDAAADLDGPKVVIAMGAAGLLTRALYRKVGSAWCYLAASPGLATAPGQLDLRTFEEYGLASHEGPDLYALVGGGQVMSSPGPEVYNKLFQESGLHAVYLPVVSTRPKDVLGVLLRLGLKGAGVTMPLKQGFAAITDELSPQARAAGAVNTLVVRGHVLHGHLTDGAGALAAVRKAAGKPLKGTAAVLGTGGAAAAVASALKDAGLQVVVLGRRPERAASLASRLGCRWCAIADLPGLEFDILGARLARMHSVLVSRGEDPQETDRGQITPDATIEQLSELPGIIAAL